MESVKNVTVVYGKFEWNHAKELDNIKDHRCDFRTAAEAFKDPKGILSHDEKHSEQEPRFFWIGKVGEKILTVRFTRRKSRVRIIGAGYWRKGKEFYEKENT